jgi:hypothetical protein
MSTLVVAAHKNVGVSFPGGGGIFMAQYYQVVCFMMCGQPYYVFEVGVLLLQVRVELSAVSMGLVLLLGISPHTPRLRHARHTAGHIENTARSTHPSLLCISTGHIMTAHEESNTKVFNSGTKQRLETSLPNEPFCVGVYPTVY